MGKELLARAPSRTLTGTPPRDAHFTHLDWIPMVVDGAGSAAMGCKIIHHRAICSYDVSRRPLPLGPRRWTRRRADQTESSKSLDGCASGACTVRVERTPPVLYTRCKGWTTNGLRRSLLSPNSRRSTNGTLSLFSCHEVQSDSLLPTHDRSRIFVIKNTNPQGFHCLL